jgi:hypothetical protein
VTVSTPTALPAGVLAVIATVAVRLTLTVLTTKLTLFAPTGTTTVVGTLAMVGALLLNVSVNAVGGGTGKAM